MCSKAEINTEMGDELVDNVTFNIFELKVILFSISIFYAQLKAVESPLLPIRSEEINSVLHFQMFVRFAPMASVWYLKSTKLVTVKIAA